MNPDIKEPHFSYSQIETYIKCGIRWREIYLGKRIIPPGIALLRGKNFHKGVEYNHRQKIKSHTDLPGNEIVDYAVDQYDKQLMKEEVLFTKEERSIGIHTVLGQTRDSIVSLLDIYTYQMAPQLQPTIVEETIMVNIADETPELKKIKPIACVIDVVDDQEAIHEFKTGGKLKPQHEVDDSLQLDIEAIAYFEKTGKLPEKIVVDNFVATKKPYYKPLVTYRTGDIYSRTFKYLFTIIEAIEKGVFLPPPPGSWWCSEKWCGFYPTCRFAQRGML